MGCALPPSRGMRRQAGTQGAAREEGTFRRLLSQNGKANSDPRHVDDLRRMDEDHPGQGASMRNKLSVK
jgi:hypothetical protein